MENAINVVQDVNEGRYWLQCQAPAGNWYDSLGTPRLDIATSHMEFLQNSGKICRIVTKTIDVLIGDE